MKNLLKLLNDNRQRAPQQRGQSRLVMGDGSQPPALYIYDAIVMSAEEADWWGGVAAEVLVPQIRGITAEKMDLYVNSPGGDVFAANAIAQAIRECSAHVFAHIDGYAASAATDIVIAADEADIAPGGFFMIHNSWTIAIGDANDMDAAAALLRKVDNSIAAKYAQRTGKPVDEIKPLMDAETWFTAEEAVEFGFVNKLAEGRKAKANAWNLSAYKRPPMAAVSPPTPAPAAAPAPVQTPAHISDDHRARQQQRLQLALRT